MVDHYDKVLVGIATSLLGGILVGLVTGLALETGVAAGAVVSTVFLYDAMIRHPPVPPTDPRVVATAVVWHAFLFVALVAALPL